jgi:hypothetical protein
MDWAGWLQTVLNAALAGGIGFGSAWAQGANNRVAIGSGITTGGAVLAGLFQKSPKE